MRTAQVFHRIRAVFPHGSTRKVGYEVADEHLEAEITAAIYRVAAAARAEGLSMGEYLVRQQRAIEAAQRPWRPFRTPVSD